MILADQLPWGDDDWRRILRTAVRDPETLHKRLNLEATEADWLDSPAFEVLVPEPYLARIQPGNPRDPLLLQVAPSRLEEALVDGYTPDPLNESSSMDSPGIMKKYSGRALYLATSECPIHCRYCFRRHFPYAENRSDSVEQVLETVRNDDSIQELILSGGDPLLLSDDRLNHLLQEAASVAHLKTIRLHTRFVVVIPQRVTSGLIDALSNARQKIVLVTHVNHPREIDSDVASAFQILQCADLTLLNQSVLLRDVNDSSDVLAELSQRLFEIGVLPYYLHLLDKVEGAAHFDVAEDEALKIYRGLQTQLPGYLVPRLARESPGAAFKTLVVPNGS